MSSKRKTPTYLSEEEKEQLAYEYARATRKEKLRLRKAYNVSSSMAANCVRKYPNAKSSKNRDLKVPLSAVLHLLKKIENEEIDVETARVAVEFISDSEE